MLPTAQAPLWPTIQNCARNLCTELEKESRRLGDRRWRHPGCWARPHPCQGRRGRGSLLGAADVGGRVANGHQPHRRRCPALQELAPLRPLVEAPRRRLPTRRRRCLEPGRQPQSRRRPPGVRNPFTEPRGIVAALTGKADMPVFLVAVPAWAMPRRLLLADEDSDEAATRASERSSDDAAQLSCSSAGIGPQSVLATAVLMQ